MNLLKHLKGSLDLYEIMEMPDEVRDAKGYLIELQALQKTQKRFDKLVELICDDDWEKEIYALTGIKSQIIKALDELINEH